MIVFKVIDFANWHKKRGNIELLPINSKKGYFLTDQKDLWPELDWDSLETIDINENDLIV